MKKFYLLLLSSFLLFCNQSFAQYQYYCDFEDDAELANWELNSGKAGPTLPNKWFVGSAVNNGGSRSLYVSSEPEGKNTNYENKALTVTAYRTLTLPVGRFELSFDWQAVGLPSDGMYVCWVPDSEIVPSTATSALSPWVALYALDFGGRYGALLNSASWNTISTIIESDGTPHKLVFVWHNGVVSAAPPASCVDNIYLFPEGKCKKPSNIKVQYDQSDGTVMVSWIGSADSYDVRYRLPGDEDWTLQTGVTKTFILLQNEREGAIEVYVRSKCGDAYTAWTSYAYFIWRRGLRCIDIYDLNDNNCYVGTHFSPKNFKLCIDGGYRLRDSRHTIHYDKFETDPRTDGRVNTVPKGEIASIRLGNWNIGNEAEAIEYKYHVDADKNAILLLKYAAVLQDPGHPTENQPRFSIRVLGADGKSLDEVCIDEDFVAGENTAGSGWVQAKNKQELINGIEGSDVPARYKDWTSIGINLKDYDKQDLTIELTTYDCQQSGHYGYAYFTINCSDGKVRGLSCGDSEENIFEAPVGFKYLWYLANDESKTMVSDQQRLVISDPSDTRTYACDIMSLTDAGCYYTMYAVADPRFPFPDARYVLSDVGCENTVVFTDSSHVVRINPATLDTIHETILPDSVLWNFDLDSPTSQWVKDENPVRIFPHNGGYFRVGVKAFLAECEEVQVIELDIPYLDFDRDTTYERICRSDGGVDFRGSYYTETGIYSDTVAAEGSPCGAIYTLNLYVGEPTDTIVNDTICSSSLPYIVGDKEFTENGNYTIKIKNGDGCDSTITLNLVVSASLNLDIPDVVKACADEPFISLPYSVSSSVVSTCDIIYSDPTINNLIGAKDLAPNEDGTIIPLPIDTALLPAKYDAEVVFKSAECGDFRKRVTIDILYPDTIITQRWNDVLAIRNDQYNGGYMFTNCQWYIDGSPIGGAIGTIYYQTGGLDTDHTYSALLVRQSDGVAAFTCEVTPIKFADNEIVESPVVTFRGQEVEVQSVQSVCASLYSMSGVLLSVQNVGSGSIVRFVDLQSGVYLLHLQCENGRVVVEKIIIR